MKCILCNSSKQKILIPSTTSGTIVKCTKCGFVFAIPARPDLMIKAAKGQRIIREVLKDKILEARQAEINAQRRINVLKEIIGEKRGKLLDVGCYAGFFLNIARKHRFDVYGIEPSYGGAKYAIDKFKLKVKISTLKEAKFPNDFFDVVTLFHVIEHVPSPVGLLKEIHRVLAPKGIVMIETPNYNNVWVKVLRSKWRQFLTDHFYFFDNQSIKKILSKTSFKIIYNPRSIGKVLSLDLFVDRIERYYSKRAGKFFKKLFVFFRLGKKTIYLNLGDIMIVIGEKY